MVFASPSGSSSTPSQILNQSGIGGNGIFRKDDDAFRNDHVDDLDEPPGQFEIERRFLEFDVLARLDRAGVNGIEPADLQSS